MGMFTPNKLIRFVSLADQITKYSEIFYGMDSILFYSIIIFLTGFTGFTRCFYTGFPDESLQMPIAFGDKKNYPVNPVNPVQRLF